MATRRESERAMSALDVAALVDRQLPPVEWDGTVDWQEHCLRASRRRDERRILAAEYGYSPFDLFKAKYDRGQPAPPKKTGRPA